MNLTLSVDKGLVERARRVARDMGTTLNALIRQHLEMLAGDGSVEATVEELRELSRTSGGRSRGWRFDRDEIHERS